MEGDKEKRRRKVKKASADASGKPGSDSDSDQPQQSSQKQPQQQQQQQQSPQSQQSQQPPQVPQQEAGQQEQSAYDHPSDESDPMRNFLAPRVVSLPSPALEQVAPLQQTTYVTPYTASEPKPAVSTEVRRPVDMPPPAAEDAVPEDLPPASVGADGSLILAGRGLDHIPAEVLSDHEKKKVKLLDLSFNSLSKISNLAAFPSLETLIVDNNNLSGPQDFSKSKTLRSISLNHNDIDDLKPFIESVAANFPNLTHLSMLRNPACPNFFNGNDEDDYKKYRYFVIYSLPSLKFLDASNVTAAETTEAKRVGKFMIPARPTKRPETTAERRESSGAAGGEAGDGTEGGNAGAGTGDAPGEEEDPWSGGKEVAEEPRGSAHFGVRKYVYRGKNSEGNRFISDTSL